MYYSGSVFRTYKIAANYPEAVAVFWLRDGAGRLIESGPAEWVFDAPVDPDAVSYLRGIRG